MPSFTRRVASTSKPAPPGTHPSPSTPTLPLLSTGLPSLDDLLGGGFPLGSTLLILAPDNHSAWSRLVERYWIAQGLVLGQKSVVVGDEGEGRDLVEGCMWIDKRIEGGSESEGESFGDGDGVEVGQGRGGTRIAWRYERMKKFQTTVASRSGGSSSPLTLTTTIPMDILSHLHSSGTQSYLPLNHPTSSSFTAKPDILQGALKRIQELLEKADSGQATRITIHELGSLDWNDKITSQQIHRFLHSLRGMIRAKSAAALITLPAVLAQSPPQSSFHESIEEWIKSLSWAVDGCIELRGFADDPILPPLFPHSHGLLTLHQFPRTHTLLPSTLKHSSILGVSQSSSSSTSHGGAGENNLSFRLKRKQFVLETLHLGVEGGVGERRTEPVPQGVGSVLGVSQGLESGSGNGMAAVPGVEGLVQVQVQVEGGYVKPKGPVEGKKGKQRARVRFGGESVELEPEVPARAGGAVEDGDEAEDDNGRGGIQRPLQHDHQDTGHHHHHHHHDHDHTADPHQPGSARDSLKGKTDQPGKPIVRHDRMDLYEF